MCTTSSWRSEDGVRFPGAGVRLSYEKSCECWELNRSSARAANSLDCWAISPAPRTLPKMWEGSQWPRLALLSSSGEADIVILASLLPFVSLDLSLPRMLLLQSLAYCFSQSQGSWYSSGTNTLYASWLHWGGNRKTTGVLNKKNKNKTKQNKTKITHRRTQ